ncbi:MAG TPA: peptidase U32 [Treponema sp.]|nr:peptidase U32 [Treponema sp.]
MELLSPAGSADKLRYCWTYGADAAYIGLKNFSLRVKADNFYGEEYQKVRALKERFPGKKLYCALNISFHNGEIDRFLADIPYFRLYPIDAFIVQDLGIVPILQREFPGTALHLSTQASCMNREAVKVYKSLGFSRIVMGREASLREIGEIKDAVPDMEIECFVHGAMCIAYAGRCLMSAYLNGRSAQEGFCSHTCRWDYDVLANEEAVQAAARAVAQSGALALREHKRPDEYFPVYEGDNFTAVLSSKDLCMIDHLAQLKSAGVDSLKIEGRMKSVYYVAIVTSAYRKALDALEGTISAEEAAPFREELFNVSHRPFSTGFYFGREEADKTASGASDSPWQLAAQVGEPYSDEARDAVLAKGRELKERRQAAFDALVPAAQAAWRRREAALPDKYLPPVENRAGWRMYPVEALNMIGQDSTLELITPERGAQRLGREDFLLVNPNTGEVYRWVCADHPCVIYTRIVCPDGSLLRAQAGEETA